MNFEHLDMVIAFAVVLLGVSLLITVLTQMISSLLALRGQNLRRARVDLIGIIHPTLSEHAEELVRRVLQNHLVSDSSLQSYSNAVAGKRWLQGDAGGLLAAAAVWLLTHFPLSGDREDARTLYSDRNDRNCGVDRNRPDLVAELLDTC